MQERVLYLYNSINDIYQGYYLIDGETPSRGQIGGRSYTGADGITVNENTAEISNDLVTSGGTIGGNTQIDGDLTIDGNIYQRGSAYETHAEKIYTKKDMIITRDGAESPLGADELTGFKAKHYDNDGNDGILAFDRNGTARVGDYTKDKVFTVYSSDGVTFYSDSEMTEEVTIPSGVTPELVEGNEYTYTQDVNDTEPILTRSEETDLNNNDILMWNSTQKKAVNVPRPSLNNTVLTAKIQNNQTTYEWKSGGSAGVAFKGTRSAYNTAKLIPEGSDGHIPSGALVIITDEGKTYVTNGTGSSQTLELVANATFNGSHALWDSLTLAQKAMYNIVNFTDDEAIGLQISDVVQDGNMNPVSSNAVADCLKYSTNEVVTGKTWIDGKPIYRKAFEFTNVTFVNGAADLGPFSSLGINTQGLIRTEGMTFWTAWTATSTFYFSAGHCYCKHQMADTNISGSTVRFVAEYTKD